MQACFHSSEKIFYQLFFYGFQNFYNFWYSACLADTGVQFSSKFQLP